jgi:hypothetical protein
MNGGVQEQLRGPERLKVALSRRTLCRLGPGAKPYAITPGAEANAAAYSVPPKRQAALATRGETPVDGLAAVER